MRATLVGLPFGPALGPSLLLRALTAAVIARMERFSVMFIAGCGLGVVETVILWNKGEPTLVDPVMFVIVVGTLLVPAAEQGVARRGPGRLELAERRQRPPGAPRAGRAPRGQVGDPGPAGRLRRGRSSRSPSSSALRDTNLAAAVAIYSIIAMSLVLLTGWAGEISLGQVAFVAIGAAAAGAVNVRWDLDPIAELPRSRRRSAPSRR